MKKLIAILVVFAVMTTALFAQDAGSWSVWGSGEIGTLLNFAPLELRDDANDKSEQVMITAGGHAYNRYDYYGDVAGQFGFSYRKGGLSTGLGFNQNGKIGANVNYDGDGLRFQAEGDLIDLFEGRYKLGRLWGWQKYLDGMLHVEVAVDSRDTQFWNTSSGLIDDSYTKVDHHNYLVLDVAPIDGLSFGFMLPGIFTMFTDTNANQRNDKEPGYVGQAKGDLSTLNPWITSNWAGWNTYSADGVKVFGAYRRFIEGSLEQMTFGARFASGPFAVSGQYGLRRQEPTLLAEKAESHLDNVFYLGAQFGITSEMSANLALHGRTRRVQATDADKLDLRVGGRFSYNAAPLSARLDVIYFNDYNSARENGMLRIRPYVTYTVIPNTLNFRLDTRVDLPLGDYPLDGNFEILSAAMKDNDLNRSETLRYRVIPELFFNFRGNGIGDYWSVGSGIVVQYRLEGRIYGAEYMDALNASSGDSLALRHRNDPTTNTLAIVFKWGF